MPDLPLCPAVFPVPVKHHHRPPLIFVFVFIVLLERSLAVSFEDFTQTVRALIVRRNNKKCIYSFYVAYGPWSMVDRGALWPVFLLLPMAYVFLFVGGAVDGRA